MVKIEPGRCFIKRIHDYAHGPDLLCILQAATQGIQEQKLA